jgi:hypothetical protein
MGYHMQVRETNFRIRRANFKPALEAIKALAGKETLGTHFSWVNTSEFVKARTLAEGFRAWRWDLDIESDDGDAIDIQFRGEKLGDDEMFFQAVAPFVEKGSYIEMQGDEGAIWRWAFDGTTVKDVEAKLVWE